MPSLVLKMQNNNNNTKLIMLSMSVFKIRHNALTKNRKSCFIVVVTDYASAKTAFYLCFLPLHQYSIIILLKSRIYLQFGSNFVSQTQILSCILNQQGGLEEEPALGEEWTSTSECYTLIWHLKVLEERVI